ncbi:preprotein translocase subunit SecA [Lederbergia citri]|uniref:Protein translocase subunit SecA n=1 Tax=Lederbergia citri TaxID=2833580 RepID=A0A942YG45_9BACI|nr:preprotein translocase subunit SecA [Lederbergia citri]MBS4195738.1 preprotein translocase subunit SecA [Lederbergia citri]
MSTLQNHFMKFKSRLHMNKLLATVNQINALENKFEKLSQDELIQKTKQLKIQLKEGKAINQLTVEAFAMVREASKRTIGQRHYDVQLLGGLVLADGNIAQMETGEGKTLVASLPSFLFALHGKGVHVITANEYLAKRDLEIIGQIHQYLGLTISLNVSDLSPEEKQAAYSSDIIYGTGSEFGFDYLRDNMEFNIKNKVQRGHNFAIIDEIDSILIDEARTPLIIANKSNISSELFQITSKIVKSFTEKIDYELDLPYRQVQLTEKGARKVEKAFGIDNIYDAEHQILLHFITQSMQAQFIFRKDTDYIVREGKIELVDAFTGRVMDGRTLSNGLHQAIEAKENLEINEENETQASVTVQNYFRMYKTLCGMTGSAIPAQEEFNDIYGLDVIEIPTNRPKIRQDFPDVVYSTLQSKYEKIIKEVQHYHGQKRPILLGTTSIEQSEKLSLLLKKHGLKHQLLNAKSEEQEAQLIALAGQESQITIATNMAGRGTDILLGDGVAKLGGLHIIGTERHESRRIDMQLRGRAGRQGDPGTTQFIISLEDDLMLQYDDEELEKWRKKMKTDALGEIISPNPQQFVNLIQETIENTHFSSRVHLLKLDDIVDQQRKSTYYKRDKLLLKENIPSILISEIEQALKTLINDVSENDREINEDRIQHIFTRLSLMLPIVKDIEISSFSDKEDLSKYIFSRFSSYKQHLTQFIMHDENLLAIQRILLQNLDQHWIDHMNTMETLKDGITLRSYSQEDPYRIFVMEAHNAYDEMTKSYQLSITNHIYAFIKSDDQHEEV